MFFFNFKCILKLVYFEILNYFSLLFFKIYEFSLLIQIYLRIIHISSMSDNII